jgi:hypothetical protein
LTCDKRLAFVGFTTLNQLDLSAFLLAHLTTSFTLVFAILDTRRSHCAYYLPNSFAPSYLPPAISHGRAIQPASPAKGRAKPSNNAFFFFKHKPN